MRPVNLLPEDQRPRRGGGGGKSAHIALGVLGTLVALVAVYALFANQVNSRKTDIARAKEQTRVAEAKVAALGPFAQFAAVKETRVSSVKDLSSQRFDWERLMREVATVLPSDTWLTEANAATGTGDATGATSDSAAPSSATSPAGTPTLQLKGCAVSQRDVAVLLVRLGKLHLSNDVRLAESAEEDNAAAGATADGASATSPDSCGNRRFKFDVTVTFDTPTAADDGAARKVPASLGGGS